MKVMNNIEIIDLGLYFDGNFVFSDFHIGYEEALNKEGILVPRFQFESIIKRLDKIFLKLNKKKIDKIIINGDIKHEFGTISEQEWRHTLRLLDYLLKKCDEVVLIKGWRFDQGEGGRKDNYWCCQFPERLLYYIFGAAGEGNRNNEHQTHFYTELDFERHANSFLKHIQKK